MLYTTVVLTASAILSASVYAVPPGNVHHYNDTTIFSADDIASLIAADYQNDVQTLADELPGQIAQQALNQTATGEGPVLDPFTAQLQIDGEAITSAQNAEYAAAGVDDNVYRIYRDAAYEGLREAEDAAENEHFFSVGASVPTPAAPVVDAAPVVITLEMAKIAVQVATVAGAAARTAAIALGTVADIHVAEFGAYVNIANAAGWALSPASTDGNPVAYFTAIDAYNAALATESQAAYDAAVTACVVLSAAINAIDATTPPFAGCTSDALNALLDSTRTVENAAAAVAHADALDATLAQAQAKVDSLSGNNRRRSVRWA